MLVDEWVETTTLEAKRPELVWDETEASPFSRADRLAQAKFTLDHARRSQKFVISPLVLETASALGVDRAALDRSAPWFFLPASTTWIDLSSTPPAGGIPGARHGVLMIADDDGVQRGQAIIIAHVKSGRTVGHTDWGSGGFAQFGFRFDAPARSLGLGLFSHQSQAWVRLGANVDRLVSTIWATIAMINTPRLSDVVDRDLGKINRARAKTGRPPILEYKMVNITVDRGELGHGLLKTETRERALHHVRAFLRLARGKVQLVRPHWRGNPRFGVIVHRYVVMRLEDEAGSWKGEPLPPPRVIKELQV